MWWFRTIALVAVLAVLGGCGFRPLYGARGAADQPQDLGAIKVEPIADRLGQMLHNHLLTAINPDGQPGNPRFVMNTAVRESATSLAVRKTAFATRANLKVTANYALTRVADGKRVFNAVSTITVSYNILDSDFATLMAEKDARARAVRELSEDIRIRLGVHFSNPPDG